jgi:hypothetical protein
MRVIQAYFVVHLRDQMAYLGEVALGGIILAVLLFVLTQLWQATFRFQGADGQVRIARWVFEPRAGLERLTAEQLTSMPADFLADELRRRVATAPVEFDMVLQFPGAGDDVNNPTIAWPDDRPRTMVGRLTVTEVAAGPGGACELVLQKRSARFVYAHSPSRTKEAQGTMI